MKKTKRPYPMKCRYCGEYFMTDTKRQYCSEACRLYGKYERINEQSVDRVQEQYDAKKKSVTLEGCPFLNGAKAYGGGCADFGTGLVL